MKKTFAALGAVITSILVIGLISLLLFGPTRLTADVVVIGAAHVILLGVPAFLVLHLLEKIRWWSSVLAGYLCGALPTAIFLRTLVIGEPGDNSSSGAGEEHVQTMIDGVATAAGWLNYLMAFSFMGAIGAVAALGFWFVWSRVEAS